MRGGWWSVCGHVERPERGRSAVSRSVSRSVSLSLCLSVWSYQLAGFPCVAVRPARSCPWAAPPDCTLLLGSLKDQEENLIVVRTRTPGEGRERRHTRQSDSVPSSSPCILQDIMLLPLPTSTHTNERACTLACCSLMQQGNTATWKVYCILFRLFVLPSSSSSSK